MILSQTIRPEGPLWYREGTGMEDYIVRVISESRKVRGLACITTGVVDEICRRHKAAPTASAALGRAVTGGVLMGALMKRDQRVALKFEGTGPLRKILVEADGEGAVRGYVGEPHVTVPPTDGVLDVSAAIGKVGLLTVVKDLGVREPYSGTVELVSGEIAEDIAYYLTESEQIPSAVGIGVYLESRGHVGVSGGFLVQSLPPSDEANVESIVQMIRSMPSVTELLRDGTTPEAILEYLFSEVPFETLQKTPLSTYCLCSRERMERGLLSLGTELLEELIEEQEEAELVCDFCRRDYHFTRDDMKDLLQELRAGTRRTA
jgi:molecular chaperone Hsp33